MFVGVQPMAFEVGDLLRHPLGFETEAVIHKVDTCPSITGRTDSSERFDGVK
jgi:hypothetical protein